MKRSLRWRFIEYGRNHQLFNEEDKILLAVSGGVDSVVMLDLFNSIKANIGMAHYNYKLRGEDSDLDEEFVKQLAGNYFIESFLYSEESLIMTKDSKKSIQIAARDLRYSWLKQIAKANGYTKIATAHTSDDNTETILLNLSKGSVMKGLNGIPIKAEQIIRPLLFTKKEELIEYARENEINWREDKSNQSDKYQRNIIRNKIIPVLKDLNPSLTETISEAASIRQEIQEWFATEAKKLTTEFSYISNGFRGLKYSQIASHVAGRALLFEIYQPLGINNAQAGDLFRSLSTTEKREIKLKNNRLVKDRDTIWICPYNTEDNGFLEISKEGEFHFNNITILCERQEPVAVETDSSNSVSFRVDKLLFPLIFRRWKPGDWFRYEGTNSKKKISDYLTDLKVPSIIKENQLVMQSGEKVIWVCGLKADKEYLSDKNSKHSFLITIITDYT